MAQKTIKEQELDLLKKLYAFGGYFTAAFSSDDLDLMERNIKADYDLLCGTTRDMSSEMARLLQEKNEAIDKANRSQKEYELLAESYDKVVADREAVRDEFIAARDAWEVKARELRLRINALEMQVIRRKLQLKEDITDKEANSLIEMLDCYED